MDSTAISAPIDEAIRSSQKMEEEEEEDAFSDEYDSDDYEGTPEEIERFSKEIKRTEGFEIDFEKVGYLYDWNKVDLDDCTMSSVQTNIELITMLSDMALKKHNAETNSRLELGKILRANYHPSGGVTFYISFQVNDPSNGKTKPYQAKVRYLPCDMEVLSCRPKPSSSYSSSS
ncbi:unnamed protein product [Cochlearia groenlandica]